MTQIILELPDHFSKKLQIQAQFRQKDVKQIILDAIGKFIDVDDKDKMSFDVTQDPIYQLGSANIEESVENYSENIDKHLYNESDYPK